MTPPELATPSTGSPKPGRNTSDFIRSFGWLTRIKLVGVLLIIMSVIRIWRGLDLLRYDNYDALPFDVEITHHHTTTTTTKLLDTKNKTTRTITTSDSTISDQEYCRTKLRLRSSPVNKTHIDWTDPIFKRSGWDIDPFVIESHNVSLFFIFYLIGCILFLHLYIHSFLSLSSYFGLESYYFLQSPKIVAQNGKSCFVE